MLHMIGITPYLKHVMLSAAALLCLAVTPPATAHPHVFIDGGVDFQFDDQARLTALQVTWLYDPFETLYILANNSLDLNSDGTLEEADRLALEEVFGQWPEDFDGSAHLTFRGFPVPLKWPSAPEVHLVDGRIQAVFERELEVPLHVGGLGAELAFYESTYFFAFKITNTPQLLGATPCSADVIPFEADQSDSTVLAKLASLGREEIPEDVQVGRLFADRISLICE